MSVCIIGLLAIVFATQLTGQNRPSYFQGLAFGDELRLQFRLVASDRGRQKTTHKTQVGTKPSAGMCLIGPQLRHDLGQAFRRRLPVKSQPQSRMMSDGVKTFLVSTWVIDG